MLGASGVLGTDVNVDLHAKVATQADDVLESISRHVGSGEIRDTVVLQVGNNGLVTESQLRGMLEELTGVQRVVLVNVSVPRPWMNPNNVTFAAVAPDFGNVAVADWAAESAEHRDYMVKDGVHLTAKGAAAYTDLITETAGITTAD